MGTRASDSLLNLGEIGITEMHAIDI